MAPGGLGLGLSWLSALGGAGKPEHHAQPIAMDPGQSGDKARLLLSTQTAMELPFLCAALKPPPPQNPAPLHIFSHSGTAPLVS